MRILKLLIVISIPYISVAQKVNVYPQGTYIISAITKEGIVVGADSRVSMFEGVPEHSRIYAHIDGVQKIFVYKNIFFEMDGLEDFSTYTIYGIFKKFKEENKTAVTVKNFYKVFLNFAKKKLSESDYQSMISNHTIISGYYKTVPCIYVYQGSRIDSSFSKGFKTNNYLDNSHNEFETAISKYSISQGLVFVKGLIQIISKSNPEVGGEVSLGYILPNGTMKTYFQTKYNYITTRQRFLEGYNDKIKIIYQSKEDSIIYKQTLKKLLNR